MKFYIASSLKNIENVRQVAENLKARGFQHTYDWTTHSNVDTITKLSEIGQEEVTGVLAADVVIVMIPAGKGSHVELGIALGAGKKIYLYSSTNELNEVGNTCTFYHVDSVEQRIGSLDDLINSVCLYHQHHSAIEGRWLPLINLKDYSDYNAMKSLLSECMWSDVEKINAEVTKYLQDGSRDLYGRFLNDELVGLIGVIHGSIGEVELKHIAIKPEHRGKGLGRKMVREYVQAKNIVIMKAETDKDAVGFYTRIGFTIVSLGEKYPGVERFECTYPRND